MRNATAHVSPWRGAESEVKICEKLTRHAGVTTDACCPHVLAALRVVLDRLLLPHSCIHPNTCDNSVLSSGQPPRFRSSNLQPLQSSPKSITTSYRRHCQHPPPWLASCHPTVRYCNQPPLLVFSRPGTNNMGRGTGGSPPRILSDRCALLAFRDELPRDTSLGFVPTMGNLHDGHGVLISESVRHCDVTLVSIYVNPKQFGVGEDFASYPRTLQHDLQLCERLGATAIFAPSADAVYADDHATTVSVASGKAERNTRAEGFYRPVMFDGVGTVMAKLLCAIQPHTVWMGQKDAQQLTVVRSMLKDLWMRTELRIVPTAREAGTGLAMSSRNSYLTEEQRKRAGVVYAALCLGQRRFEEGERDAETIRKVVHDAMQTEVDKWDKRKQSEFIEDYVSVCGRWDMREIDGAIEMGQSTVLCVGVRLAATRLVDNVVLFE